MDKNKLEAVTRMLELFDSQVDLFPDSHFVDVVTNLKRTLGEPDKVRFCGIEDGRFFVCVTFDIDYHVNDSKSRVTVFSPLTSQKEVEDLMQQAKLEETKVMEE